MKRRFAVVIGSVAGVLALAGTALADTNVQVTVGPAPIPAVPVEVCVSQEEAEVDDCVATPPADSVSLTVTVHVDTPDPVLVPPTVTPIACPLGTQGVGARVFSGSASAIVSGFVTVVVDDGVPVTVQIDEVVLVGGQTLTVFACAGLTPGASLPSLPVSALL